MQVVSILFGLASSELGISSSTINITLSVAILIVIALPLFFVLRSQNNSSITSRKVTL